MRHIIGMFCFYALIGSFCIGSVHGWYVQRVEPGCTLVYEIEDGAVPFGMIVLGAVASFGFAIANMKVPSLIGSVIAACGASLLSGWCLGVGLPFLVHLVTSPHVVADDLPRAILLTLLMAVTLAAVWWLFRFVLLSDGLE